MPYRYFDALDYRQRLRDVVMRPRSDGRLNLALFDPHAVHIDDASDDEKAKELFLYASSPLVSSTVYFFSSHVCNLISEASKSLPLTATLETNLIPSFASFWWFESPLELTGGMLGPLRAVTWMCFDPIVEDGKEVGIIAGFPTNYSPASSKMLRLVFWLDAENETVKSGADSSPWRGLPIPGTQMPWMFGSTPTEAMNGVANQSGLAIDDGHIRAQKLRYLLAALLFIRQKYLIMRRETPPRAVRRRIDPSPNQSEVVVVTLRSAEHKDPTDKSEPQDWAYRWWVRGHWRMQACGEGRQERNPVWIMPYIKGPEGKPLKARLEQIFAVTR